MTVGRLIIYIIIAIVIMIVFGVSARYAKEQTDKQGKFNSQATATAEVYVDSEKEEDINSKVAVAESIASNALELDSTQRIFHAIVAAHIIKSIDGENKFDRSPYTRRILLQLLNEQPADISEPSQIHLDDKPFLVNDTFSNEDKWMLTFQEKNEPFLVDLRKDTTDNLLQIDVGKAPISQAAFSPHDKWLVLITEDDTPKLVNLENVSNGYKAISLDKHKLDIADHEFSQNDKWFVTSSYDSSIQLWPLEGLNQENAETKLKTLSHQDDMQYPGHKRSVTAISFDPESHWLGSGDLNGEVFLWNLDTTDPALHPIHLKIDDGLRVADIQFTKNDDKEWLIAIGRNDNIDRAYYWNMKIEHLINKACQLYNPTPEQKDEIMPDAYPFELSVCSG